MAAAAAGAAAGSSTACFVFTNAGSLDYTDAAVLAALGDDPWVYLEGSDHPLVHATNFAQWDESPIVPPASVSAGKRIRQSVLDSWCLMGGVVTPAFKAHKDILLRSVRADKAGEFFSAHVLVGDLDLSVSHTARTWPKALASSARACSKDARVRLEDEFFFNCQARPVSGAGSGAAENWMYGWSGEMLAADDITAHVAGVLVRAAAPRNLSASRDANLRNFRRFLNALAEVTRTRSSFFKDAMRDPSTPVDELQEYLIDTWRKLVETDFNFMLTDRISQRSMEIVNAAQLACGTAAQQELICKTQLPQELDAAKLVCKCIGGPDENYSTTERMESFELLADIFFPGAKWASFSMVRAVELELKELVHIINDWGSTSVTQRLASLRAQPRVKPGGRTSKSSGGVANLAEEELTDGVGASGILAMRSAAFLDTKAKVKELTDGGNPSFTKLLDLLGASQSKIWRAVGLGKLKKAAGVSEIESCSKATGKWPKYWTIGLATNPDGSVSKEAQGESQSDTNTDGLLSGRWGRGVNWIQVMQSMEYFRYAILPSDSAAYHKFDTLTSVKDTLCKTMTLLGLASPNDRDGYTAAGFMDRIIALERRSRALPKGSEARADAQEEFVDLLLDGLDEFGERWVDQFKAPVNYMDPIITTFSDENCFIYNRLDTAEDTAQKTFQFRKLLLPKKRKSSDAGGMRDSDSDDEGHEGQTLTAHKGTRGGFTAAKGNLQVLTG